MLASPSRSPPAPPLLLRSASPSPPRPASQILQRRGAPRPGRSSAAPRRPHRRSTAGGGSAMLAARRPRPARTTQGLRSGLQAAALQALCGGPVARADSVDSYPLGGPRPRTPPRCYTAGAGARQRLRGAWARGRQRLGGSTRRRRAAPPPRGTGGPAGSGLRAHLSPVRDSTSVRRGLNGSRQAASHPWSKRSTLDFQAMGP